MGSYKNPSQNRRHRQICLPSMPYIGVPSIPCYRSSICLMMILIHLLLLITSNVLAIDEEQKEIILGMIKELSRKAVQGEEIAADNPLSILPVKSMSRQRQTRKW